MNERARKILMVAASLAAAGALSACSSDGVAAQGDEARAESERDRGGFLFFGRGDDEQQEDSVIGVNSFLWRASLDTLNFMPLASADPFGGVIITDWYSDPQRPGERFKATVYILDTRLRADALNVSIFREQMTAHGWQPVEVTPDTGIQIENAILTRARQLRLSTLRD
jgi:hypothetical protein